MSHIVIKSINVIYVEENIRKLIKIGEKTQLLNFAS